MNKITRVLFILLLVVSSLTAFKKVNKLTQGTDILEKIADANGFQNWKNIEEIKFTFNVDRDTTHFERSWAWKPKTNDITAITKDTIIKYNWSSMDSTSYKTNGGFINDKYWLLTPFQLIWDKDNITHTHTPTATAPISKKQLQKLTIVYGTEGGYTPGDAYDLYFEGDYSIQEWVFRKGNTSTPSMITTFEDYSEFKGLHIAKSHKMENSKFHLYFTNIDVQ